MSDPSGSIPSSFAARAWSSRVYSTTGRLLEPLDRRGHVDPLGIDHAAVEVLQVKCRVQVALLAPRGPPHVNGGGILYRGGGVRIYSWARLYTLPCWKPEKALAIGSWIGSSLATICGGFLSAKERTALQAVMRHPSEIHGVARRAKRKRPVRRTPPRSAASPHHSTGDDDGVAPPPRLRQPPRPPRSTSSIVSMND